MDNRAWNELLGEFRTLGGIADNVRLGNGPLGRGLFSIDPSRPVAVHVPENLLIDTRDIVFERGQLRIAPTANINDPAKSWLGRYHREISWGAGGASEIEKMFELAGALPKTLRHDLVVRHRCGSWFEDPTDDLIQERYLGSRSIAYKDRVVLMPILEMINHGPASEFNCADGIAVRGSFEGEILARYSATDAYGIFLSWGFAAEAPIALSIAVRGNIGPAHLHIDRQFDPSEKGRPYVPSLSTSVDRAKLDFLMLGHQQYPRLPRSIFNKVLRDAGFSSLEEPFEIIQHTNRLHFLDLWTALEDVKLPMAHILRQMAQHQLRTLSFCYGTRAI